MASTNGATGTSTRSSAVPRRPAAGPRKPIIPAIPLSFLPLSHRKPLNANTGTLSQAKAQSPQSQEPPKKNNDSDETSPGKGLPGRDGAISGPIDGADLAAAAPVPQQDHALLPGSKAATPPAAKGGVLTVANGYSTKPRLASLPSSTRETDTPTAQSQTPPARAQQSVASPTPTKRSMDPPLHVLDGSGQTSIAILREHVTSHDSVPRMAHARLHQAQPSNASLIFGGLSDSNISSPAPPGDGVPPPASASYTGSEGTTAIGIDGYGRPMLVSPGYESFPSEIFPPPGFHHAHQQLHGPPTPHSFHGSQSSAHADENGYGAHPSVNGYHGLPHQRHMATVSSDFQSSHQFSMSNGPSPACPPVSRMQAQILDFLRDGFERSVFSDCTLELRLPRGHQAPESPPLVVPCHRLILAQSPTLNRIMHSSKTTAGGHLVVEVQDMYVQPDSFGFALRTLYGWDLGDGPLIPYHPQHSVKDGFNLAVGYASCGAYLELPLIYAKGIYHACQQLQWDTIEEACQFAVPRTFFGQSARQCLYPSTDGFIPFELVDTIIAFLVNNIPADLVIDAAAGDGGFSRLPRSSVTSPLSQSSPPPIADTTSSSMWQSGHEHHAHMPRGSRVPADPRLSSIQFGDLSMVNGQYGSQNGTANSTSARSPTIADAILSRILLNLPFPMLKQVLEHPDLGKLGKPAVSLNPTSRRQLMSSIVAPREARRRAALNNDDPQLRVFSETLKGASEPLAVQEMGDFLVNSMGFEEVVRPGESPYLVQTWIHESQNSGVA